MSQDSLVTHGVDGFGLVTDKSCEEYFGTKDPQHVARVLVKEWTAHGISNCAVVAVSPERKDLVEENGFALISLAQFAEATRNFYKTSPVRLCVTEIDNKTHSDRYIHSIYTCLYSTIEELINLADLYLIKDYKFRQIERTHKLWISTVEEVRSYEDYIVQCNMGIVTVSGRMRRELMDLAVHYNTGKYKDRLWLRIPWKLLYCGTQKTDAWDLLEKPVFWLRPVGPKPDDYVKHFLEMTAKLNIAGNESSEDSKQTKSVAIVPTATVETSATSDTLEPFTPPPPAPKDEKIFTSVDFAHTFYKEACWGSGQAVIDFPFIPRDMYNKMRTRLQMAIPKQRDDGTNEISAQNECIKFCRINGLAMFAFDVGGDKSEKKRISKGYFAGTYRDVVSVFNGKIKKGFSAYNNGFRESKDFTVIERRNRYLYEFLLMERPTFPYMDMDIELDKNPEMDGRGDELTRVAIDFHIYMLKMLHGVDTEFGDYLILSADSRWTETNEKGNDVVMGKISRHIICKKHVFATMLAQRFFINYLYTYFCKLHERLKSNPDEVSDVEKRFATLKIISKLDKDACAVDVGVYKDNQLFRPGMCTKAPSQLGGKPRFMRVADINEYPVPPNSTDAEIFLLSLLQRLPNYETFNYDKALDFSVTKDLQIPLVTFSVDGSGDIAGLVVTNPGDEFENRKNGKKRKNTNKDVTDLSKRRKMGASLYSDTLLSEKELIIAWIKTTECMDIWEGRFENRTIVKKTIGKDGRPQFLIQPECQMVNARECPCLVKTFALQPDFDPTVPGARYETHGKCPIEIRLQYGWDMKTGKYNWHIKQTCSTRCNHVYRNREIALVAPLFADVPMSLLESLGIDK